MPDYDEGYEDFRDEREFEFDFDDYYREMMPDSKGG